LAKAFDLLHHDLLFVTPDERSSLLKAGVQPRASWKGSEHMEEHILHHGDGPRIGVILLPPVAYSAPTVPENLIHQMENAVRRLRGGVKLVVVMSPWGYNKEQELLRRADPGALPDILLGSGPGIGLVGSVAGNGKTAWIRSFIEGKSVVRVQVLAWPERNSTFKWTEEKNIRMSLFGLTDQYQENPELLTLMQHMGTD
jgi:hypothetical protein